MNYQITIKRTEPNPNFATELAAYEEREKCRYGNGPREYPQTDLVKNTLLCELTAEQYESVKKAVLAEFK